MRIVTAMAGLGAAGLVVMIVASSREMSLAAGLRQTTDTLWGVTTLVDLYSGLALVAAWIAVRERRAGVTVAWVFALCCLGNLATLVYLLIASLRARSPAELMLGRTGPQHASRAG